MHRLMRSVCLTMTLAAVAASADAPLRLDFSASPLDGLLKTGGRTRQQLACPRCLKAPEIDGRLDDSAWRSAGIVTRLSRNELPTRALVCFDDRALYIAVECIRRPGRELVARKRRRDGPAYRDDCVEVWIDPGRDQKRRFQLIINAGGSFFDQVIEDGIGDQRYDPPWQLAARVEADRWAVEMAIPLAALQLTHWPDRMGFNVGRNGPGLGPESWLPKYGDTSEGDLVL